MAGRPTKLTKKFIEALEKVVNDKHFYILTDEELIFSVNELLGEDVLKADTFSRYKNGTRGTNSEYYDVFVRLIKKGLIREKTNLIKKLESEDKAWQKFAWILERKFEDFNKLDKTKNENTNTQVNKIDLSKYTDEELRQLAELQRKGGNS